MHCGKDLRRATNIPKRPEKLKRKLKYFNKPIRSNILTKWRLLLLFLQLQNPIGDGEADLF
jgi:hypothetical protein